MQWFLVHNFQSHLKELLKVSTCACTDLVEVLPERFYLDPAIKIICTNMDVNKIMVYTPITCANGINS